MAEISQRDPWWRRLVRFGGRQLRRSAIIAVGLAAGWAIRGAVAPSRPAPRSRAVAPADPTAETAPLSAREALRTGRYRSPAEMEREIIADIDAGRVTDYARLARELLASPHLRLHWRPLLCCVARWGEADPEAALEFCHRHKCADENWARPWPRTSFTVIRRLKDRASMDYAAVSIATRMEERDAVRASRFIATNEKFSWLENCRYSVLDHELIKPYLGFELADATHDNRTPYSGIFSAAPPQPTVSEADRLRMVRQGESAALAAVQRPDDQVGIIARLDRSFPDEPLATRLAGVASQPPVVTVAEILRTPAAEAEPAFQAFAQLPAETQARWRLDVAASFSKDTPALAASVLAAATPDELSRPETAWVLSRVASRFVEADSVAASAWIGALPAGPARDAGVLAMLRATAAENPETAAQWAATLQSADARAQAATLLSATSAR